MSLESVFSVESHEKKSVISEGGINVQGVQVLPDIKQIEPKKYQSTLKQNNADISSISKTPAITQSWKCN